MNWFLCLGDHFKLPFLIMCLCLCESLGYLLTTLSAYVFSISLFQYKHLKSLGGADATDLLKKAVAA